MGFWNGVTPDSVASASDGFKEFIIGDNDAYIKTVQEKVSESGNDMLVITFANDDGAEIRHYIVDGEFKQQKLKQLCIAFNIPFGSMNIQSWIGKRGIVVCKQGKPNSNGNVYNQVSYLRPKPGTNVNPRPSHTQPSQPAQQQPQQSYSPPAGQSTQNDEFTDDIPFLGKAMKILVTAPGEFTGDVLKVGKYYNAEMADEGTERQNKTFHALVQCYWTSGCHSYSARSYEHFRALMKLYLGAGTEKYYSLVNEDGTNCPKGRIAYRLKSWSDYTKKERQLTIDNIINEMFLVGVNSPRFNEILQGMEERQAERDAERIENQPEIQGKGA